MTQRSWLVGALSVALVLTTGCGLLPKEQEEAPAVLAAPLKSEKATYTVRRGEITEQVTLRGRLAPARSVDLFATTDGRLRALHVRPGAKVEAGQVLAELFADEAELQLSRSRIQYEKALLSLETARQQMQYKPDFQTKNEVRSRELDLEAAGIDVARAEQRVGDTRLVAPFAGQIAAVTGKPGDATAAYASILTVVDPTELLVEADISDAELKQVAVGQQVHLDFPQGTGTGVIVELPGATNPAPGQPKRIKVKPAGLPLGTAMGTVGTAHVILREKKGVLLLEKAGVRQFSGRTYALTKEPRREVDVVLGIEGQTEWEITGGLKEGDKVLGR